MRNTVTLNQVVSNAMISLGQENDRYKVIFYEWAFEGLRDIGVTTQNLQTTTGTLTSGNTINYPTGAMYIDAITLSTGAASTQFAYPTFDSNYWDNAPDVNNPTGIGAYTVSRQGSQLIFGGNPFSNGFTHVTIRFYGMPVDKNGDPIIPEYYMRAIVGYIEHKFIKRERARNREAVPLQEVQLSYQNWISLKSDAMSKRNQPEKMEIRAAVESWRSMLAHPLMGN